MNKSPDAFRTISEVAEDLDLPQHVLRFWETRFNQIKPMKRGGGRRYYRPDDIELLKTIKAYLYDEGYTIRGVQRLLKEQGTKKQTEEVLEEIPEIVLGSTASAPEAVAVKEAVKVTEYSEPASVSKPISGLIDKISSFGSGSNAEKSKSKMSENDLSLLSGTLQDLLECKRLLDQTRQD